jgi:hypothetical protein
MSEDEIDEAEAERRLAAWVAMTERIREESAVTRFTTRGGRAPISPTLLGAVNLAPFLGHEPGTVRLDGCEDDGEGGAGRCHFSRRKRPWNDRLHPDLGWVRAVDAAGNPLHPERDFAGLPAELEDRR